MDRLFDEFFGMTPARSNRGAMWSPAINIREDKDNFYVEAELPGLSKEEIDLEVENNILSLKGERQLEEKQEGENYHFVERSYGSFYRSFTLPRNVDPEGIAASYKDGVLYVTIPKKEEVKPKKVSIDI
jgi:HSP20 family protein